MPTPIRGGRSRLEEIRVDAVLAELLCLHYTGAQAGVIRICHEDCIGNNTCLEAAERALAARSLQARRMSAFTESESSGRGMRRSIESAYATSAFVGCLGGASDRRESHAVRIVIEAQYRIRREPMMLMGGNGSLVSMTGLDACPTILCAYPTSLIAVSQSRSVQRSDGCALLCVLCASVVNSCCS
jgi:hypothetical protein